MNCNQPTIARNQHRTLRAVMTTLLQKEQI